MAEAIIQHPPPGGSSTTEVDPHPAWLAEWQRLVDWCNGPEPGGRDMQDCPEWHRANKLEDLIAGTSARILTGAAAQLRLAHHYLTGAMPEDDASAVALAGALATLNRLAGGQAHV
jgi:hypothetical protein